MTDREPATQAPAFAPRAAARVEALDAQLREAQAGLESFACGLVDAFNPHLGGHGRRVAALVDAFAAFRQLPDAGREATRNAALYHDLGLLGARHRASSLPSAARSETDRTLILLHPDAGAAQLRNLHWLAPAAPLVAAHHERWDGGGYPRKLRGEQIPIGARILAVCDAYDEMLNKPADARVQSSETDVLTHLRQERGRQFDPRVVDLFFRMLDNRPPPRVGTFHPAEVAITVRQLRPGQRLARNIVNAVGLTMLAKGAIVQDTHVLRLQRLRDTRAVVEPIYIEP